MKRSLLLWILAFFLTAASAVYQRMTGPTYPAKERITLNGQEHKIRLARSHGGPSDFELRLDLGDPSIRGAVAWRRYKTADAWLNVPMSNTQGTLTARLPHQPPAGKLEYRVTLQDDSKSISLPTSGPNVIRFKGHVPTAVIIVHVLGIFSAMLFSTRTALEACVRSPRYKLFTTATVILLFAGGFILGPIMQKYAFDAFWTGWPNGTDLTDNKTAVAFLCWLAALIAISRKKSPKAWVITAAIVTVIVFLIPHSMLGSEIDYSKVDSGQ